MEVAGFAKQEVAWEEDEVRSKLFQLTTVTSKHTEGHGHVRWSHPSAPSWGSFINWRNSAWCCWINLMSCGFCLPSSWSIGCNNITGGTISSECEQPIKRTPRNKNTNLQNLWICLDQWTQSLELESTRKFFNFSTYKLKKKKKSVYSKSIWESQICFIYKKTFSFSPYCFSVFEKVTRLETATVWL